MLSEWLSSTGAASYLGSLSEWLSSTGAASYLASLSEWLSSTGAASCPVRGEDATQLVVRSGLLLMQIQPLGAAWELSPTVSFLVSLRFCLGVLYSPCMQLHAVTFVGA